MRDVKLKPAHWIVLACIAFLGAVVVYKAWVTDDAYITFRTCENFVEGRGLTWNPDERVQVFTHPLWMFVVSATYSVTGEFFYSSLALQLLLTLVVAGLLAFRVASGVHAAVLGLTLLAVSRAFTDFATSGLENPLGHLLLVLLFVRRDDPKRPGAVCLRFALLVSLLLLTRLDLLLLVAPVWALTLWRHRGTNAVLATLVGLAPLLAWELFSLLYYGALIPNTAYAKLSTGIASSEKALQGLHYLVNSLVSDPPTLLAVALALGWTGLLAVRQRRFTTGTAWGVGVALSLLYVVRVGGDFMSGRFLTPVFVVALALAISRTVPRRPVWVATGAVAILLAVPWTTPFVDRDYGDEWHAAIDVHGIADERSFYAGRGDLWSSFELLEKWPDPQSFEEARWLRRKWPHDYFIDDLLYVGTLSPEEGWPPQETGDDEGNPYRIVIVRGAVGFLGFHLGPDVHVLDYHAITDPLLSRIPVTRPDPILQGLLPKQAKKGWRVGHYYRKPPVGYVWSLATDENRLHDPELREYYDVVRRITRDPVFDGERLRAIVRRQLGAHDHLLP
ncbi:MAG: hypothetical protein GY716_06650 [bacterium]|nr:hypothetical protein [bacterium]